MLYLGFSILLAAYLLDRLHDLRALNKAREYQYRLYALRDELREAAMDGEVNPRDWVFEYLDSSLAKTIDTLPHVSLWQALALWVAYHHSSAIAMADEQLQRELSKAGNERYGKILSAYQGALFSYLMDRHLIFRALVANLLLLRMLVDKAAAVQTKAPATSTLVEFAQAAA